MGDMGVKGKHMSHFLKYSKRLAYGTDEFSATVKTYRQTTRNITLHQFIQYVTVYKKY